MIDPTIITVGIALFAGFVGGIVNVGYAIKKLKKDVSAKEALATIGIGVGAGVLAAHGILMNTDAWSIFMTAFGAGYFGVDVIDVLLPSKPQA